MKRIIDLLGAIIGLIVLSPIIILVAILVRFSIGSSILFRQVRPGRHGAEFTLYKFRTMTNQTDMHGVFLSDAKRLTRFGKYLRKTSFDELPSLINVLKGDMSLVGPRPLLVEYFELYSPEQSRRHEVKPGITGWAQVNGRNSITWEEKFDFDVWYVDNHTFSLDIKILFLSIKKVLLREGINSQTSATMEKFNGSIPK